MKKTLIALAALAATGAFAQSTVSIVGTLDVGVKASSTANTGGTTTSNQAVASNLTSTSAIKFLGSEDLGGGMKANFLMEINPNLVQSSTSNQAYAFASDYNGTPFNGEQYIGLSGNFGDVKLGVPNAGFFGVAMMASPMGTAMGSGYGAAGVSRLGSAAPGIVSGTASGTSRIIRHERTVQYTTPSFSGFNATVDFAALNDNSTATTGAPNQDGYTGITLRYSNGPLNVGYGYAVNKFGNGYVATLAGSPYAAATTGVSAVNGDYTYNMLSGNYNFGAATVYAGLSTTKSNGITTAAAMEDSTSWNIAGKYTMGATDLLASYLVRTAIISTNKSAKVYGLGADYNLSKRTALTARFEVQDSDTNLGTTVGGSVSNAFGFGVRHTF